jgi:uncharacterized protein (TIGR02452 family)
LADNIFNKKICYENAEIVKYNRYKIGDHCVTMKHDLTEHQHVVVYSPEQAAMCVELVTKIYADAPVSGAGHIVVEDTDSFGVQTDLVLNFANARHPGGGYFSGATSQEESLCRQSTLYASISSEDAQIMYRHNKDVTELDTDYLLISPCVEVFRNRDCTLKEVPYTTAVATMAAPDRGRRAAKVSDNRLKEYYRNRIRQLLCIAATWKYKNITLGAWGCGVFRNDPEEVASAFRDILVNEGMAGFFDEVIFAIPKERGNHQNYDRDNYCVFRKIMQ